ncbi:MAG: CDP-alcohol phosphatidyltransferase family protein [Candidatus Omnitrophota bacterium]
MLRRTVYPYIQKAVDQAAGWLNRTGFTPNQLTLAGLALSFAAGILFAYGWLIPGGLILIASGLGDMLDGPLARLTGKASPFGAFLDSTVDRYADFFVLGGLALLFARTGEAVLLLLTLGSLAGSFVTSYTKARAENFIAACSVGVFERAERMILLILGTLLPPLLSLMLWVLCLGSNATALQRLFYTKKKLSGEIPPSA